jgi:RNA polymerase sigma-70 factor (ECF subfamily)
MRFDDLYERTIDQMYGYVAARIPAEHVEDTVAEIYIAAHGSLPTFEDRGEGALEAWLFGIARNVIASGYRQRRRRPPPLELAAAAPLYAEGPTPEQHLTRHERSQHLRQQVAKLSPRRREVIELRYFAGLTNKQIARTLELDERTIASHLTRALRDLHTLLTEEEPHA